MDPHVLLETVKTVVLLATVRAEERLLARVHFHVYLKARFGRESFVTLLTLVGSELRMCLHVTPQFNGPRKCLTTEAALARIGLWWGNDTDSLWL